MATPIHPEALKAYRSQKKWTQDKLADMTKGKGKTGVATIKRIEGKKDGIYSANNKIAEGLAGALGVKVEDLSKLPSVAENSEELRKIGYRPLRTMIDKDTALAFQMVQHLYGISVKSQIVMAPLFAALLAEGSLDWRRRRVGEIQAAVAKLEDLGGGHYDFVQSASRVNIGVDEEKRSIKNRDIFGSHDLEAAFEFDYDPDKNNPFADYLKNFLKDSKAKFISFDEDLSWKITEGLPGYSIGLEIIEHLTGGNWQARYALEHRYVRLKDIPAELQDDDKKNERIAWLINKVPENEFAAEEVKFNELSDLLDESSIVSGTDNSKGEDHA